MLTLAPFDDRLTINLLFTRIVYKQQRRSRLGGNMVEREPPDPTGRPQENHGRAATERLT